MLFNFPQNMVRATLTDVDFLILKQRYINIQDGGGREFYIPAIFFAT